MTDNKNHKGKYILREDFYSEESRNRLPVNAFVLREESTEGIIFDYRFFAKSKFHRTDRYFVGLFYKTISNDI